MSRIDERFALLRKTNQRALIPYIAAGDPSPQWTVDIMHALVAAGADVLELGVPFSDPMADGPVIQQAGERAIEKGVGLRDVLTMVAQFRELDQQTPLVLMGYLNPIEQFGWDAFLARARLVGVDGLLLVDAPLEESLILAPQIKASGLQQIHLIAPTTTDDRIARMGAIAEGFVYYVSLRGVTGAGHVSALEAGPRIQLIKRHCRVPVGVGFGISDAESAVRVGEFADAVIIGSALVSRLANASDKQNAIEIAQAFLRPIKQALAAPSIPARIAV